MNFIDYVSSSINNLKALHDEGFTQDFETAAKMILETITNGGSVLVCGNGGSHSDAQHFAGELVNFFTIPHRALRVIALGTNGAVATAWSNDHSFQDQFAREVQAYGDKNSVLIGITTSGRSKNVNYAFEAASTMGMKTIALASERAVSHLPKNLDITLAVPVQETHKIQELHIVIYHALCIFIEENLPKEFLT